MSRLPARPRRATTLGLLSVVFALTVGSASSGAFARAPGPDSPRVAPRSNGSPGPALPRLKPVSARQSQLAWMGIKGLGPIQQADAVDKKRLREQICSDLVDLRALSDQRKLDGFGFRDNVRQRSWARPSMALLLVTAMERMRSEVGAQRKANLDRLVSIGDVSQAGCGQLSHGVLVYHATGARAAVLEAQARLIEDRPTHVEFVTAADFPWEADRFGPPDEHVMVVSELLGKHQDQLRFTRTRYRDLGAPSAEDTSALARELTTLLAKGGKRTHKARTTADSGLIENRWVTHVIDPKTKRQAIVITSEKPGRRLDWGSVVEVRLAQWQDKKPGSMPGEVRWRVEAVNRPAAPPAKKGARVKARIKAPGPLAIDAVRWSRWSLVNEAGHISHLSGIDADLSYVTAENDRHFAVDLPVMDVALTWRWLEILVATGKELGTPIDSILVDGKIKRHLMANLPMKGPKSVAKSPVWRLLTLVGGHDAHHHIRIVEPSEAVEKRARAKLGL